MAQTSGSASASPASDKDVFLYRGMGSSYVCNARTAGVEFPKAVGIAAATYVQLLNGRHGGRVLIAKRGNRGAAGDNTKNERYSKRALFWQYQQCKESEYA